MKKYLLLGGALLLIGLLLFPFSTTVIPEWKIRVTDNSGNVLPGITVNQVWVGIGREQRDVRISDEQGLIAFPERTERAPVVVRIFFYVIQALPILHGPEYNFSYVYADGGNTSLFYLPGHEMKHELIYRKVLVNP